MDLVLFDEVEFAYMFQNVSKKAFIFIKGKYPLD